VSLAAQIDLPGERRPRLGVPGFLEERVQVVVAGPRPRPRPRGKSQSTRSYAPTSRYGSMTNAPAGKALTKPRPCCSTSAAADSAHAVPTTSSTRSPTRPASATLSPPRPTSHFRHQAHPRRPRHRHRRRTHGPQAPRPDPPLQSARPSRPGEGHPQPPNRPL